MSDVALLLLEIDTAQKQNVVSNSTTSQCFESLFDKEDDEDIGQLIKSSNNCDDEGAAVPLTRNISLCISGKSCIIHSITSKNTDGDLLAIKSIKTERVLTDTHDARHYLSEFDIKEIMTTQQRLKLKESIHCKQWKEDKEWHLRDEKLLLIQENSACSIQELEDCRYRELDEDKKAKLKTDDKVIGYTLNYLVPSHLIRPKTKIEHELIEKVAKFVIDKGIQFESMIKIKQTNNPKFDFLAPSHTYHAYYNFLKQRIKNPQLFMKKPKKQKTNNCKSACTQNTNSAALSSIASHFQTFYSDDSDSDEEEKIDCETNDANDNNNNMKRSISPTYASAEEDAAKKRSGKNSKRRKAMERVRRIRKHSVSRSRSRSRSASASWSRSRSRTRSRSRSRSFSSISASSRSRSRSRSRSFSSSSSVDSYYRSRSRKRKRRSYYRPRYRRYSRRDYRDYRRRR